MRATDLKPTDGPSETPLSPPDMVRERVVYRVRVSVSFDPSNDELRTRINRGQAELMQLLGAHAAIRGDDLELGRFELCLELAGDPLAAGSRQAAEEAVRLVKVALRRLASDPSGDEPELRIVDTQLVTTPHLSGQTSGLA